MRKEERIINMIVKEYQDIIKEKPSDDEYDKQYRNGFKDALNLLLYKLTNKDF